MAHQNQFYWLVSGPYPERSDRTFVLNNIKTLLGNRATCDLFAVPELRVGTLDALMSLSDDLLKYDSFVEAVTRKIAAQLFTLRDSQNDSQLFSVNGANVELYLTHYKWDEAKYPIKASCRELTDQINAQVSRLDEELRVKSTEYNSLSHSLAASERNQTGNLLSRDLSEYVTADNWIDSEYLTTLLVVVPKYNIKEWDSGYESFVDMVVPRSSKVIADDNEYFLMTVVVFKKKTDEFKIKSREKRFTVREFNFTPEGNLKAKEEKKKLQTQKDLQKSKLTTWCKTNFAEAFTAWIHLKTIQVYVESILRFGLPANFQAVLVLPHKKDDKKCRELLLTAFNYITTKYVSGGNDVDDSDAFYPYVSLNINLDMRPIQ